jgi:hypothetical protein
MADERDDTPDGRPARAQRELDRLAAVQHGDGGRPPGWNIPSRAGARGPVEDAMVDGWNVSSLN